MKSYYEFKGNWLHIFDKLVGIVTPANVKRFAIWQSKVKDRTNLLIVYEMNLGAGLENKVGIRRISESEFLRNYKHKMNDHVIHGFNEFSQTHKNLFSLVVRTINNIFIV